MNTCATTRPNLFQPTKTTASRAARCAMVLLSLAAMACAPLAAQAYTWDGGGGTNNWSDVANWSTDEAPVLSPDAEIIFGEAGSLIRPNPVNDMGEFLCTSVTIVGAYTVTSASKLTLTTINASTLDSTLTAPLGMPDAGLITVIQETAGKTLTLTGLISGTGGITLGGPGHIAFTGTKANTYTGLTTVNSTGTGSVRLSRSAETIPHDLTIDANGVGGATVYVDANTSQINYSSLVTLVGDQDELDISDASGTDGLNNETIGALAGPAATKVTLGSRKLGCYLAPAAPPTFAGLIVGDINSSFRKHGYFTQKLMLESDQFFGTTVVNGSTLTLLGLQPSSNITVTDGTLLLANAASVGVISMSGPSNLSIGNNGSLTNTATSKSLTLTSSSRVDTFTGTLNSKLSVVGSVNLGSARLTIDTSTSPPTAGDVIVIIDNDGTADAVIGTFASLPEGATVNSQGSAPRSFTIHYGGGDGNDVELMTITTSTVLPSITSAPTTTGTVGAAFTYTITASNGPISSYGASNMPAGLSRTGAVISGTPTAAGARTVLISATNASGTGSGTVTITIAAGASSGSGSPGAGISPPTRSSSNGKSGCGNGSGGAAVALALALGLSLCGGWRRQR